ncbi:MAG: GHKL domain-containing protein [Scytonematopsis contorta HA4267-MV1]|nr:GHKL domain-containing protein [Scytonematopsis contorta HA4267-MV1]
MGVAAVTTLTLVSVLEERIASQRELATVNEELENRVQLRTTALTEALQQLEETLLRLKQTQSQLIQAEKMSSLGQLVAGIAHEINNPVNFIYGNLTYVRDYSNNLLHLTQLYQQYYPNTLPQIQEQIDETDPNFIAQDLIKIIDSMQIGTQRIREIVLLLRNFSRLDEAEFKEVDIHEGLESTLMLLQHRLTLNDNSLHINIIKEYGTLPLVNCYASELNQVFLNILNNAIDAVSDITNKSTKQPTIWIYTQLTELNQIMISISDNGNGIPLDIQTKLFDPFFTTKAVGQGTGLGLFVSYQIIVSKHGGQLLCDSTLGYGTKFIIQIPACP